MNCNYLSTCKIYQDGQCPGLEENCFYHGAQPKKATYEEIGQNIGKLVDKKNRQYGDAINNTESILRTLYPNGIQPNQYNNASVIIRIIDKLFRISKGDQGGESAWNDITGYGILMSKEEK